MLDLKANPLKWASAQRAKRAPAPPTCLISVLAFFIWALSLFLRVEVAREQSLPPCHSREDLDSRSRLLS